ncbi:hypothetical protein [Flavobacterium sp. KMS]|uniref:hypothetical protein n=1 Tax=Flavobacterium sp. KMS TaxID=1566023 RepID=UPI000B0660E1|nr:hypothetical protein [Flavobacterium sp. KMS]
MKIRIMKNEKKYFIILGIMLFLIAATHYLDNRYVKLRLVILAEENYIRQLIFFDNNLYKFT